MSDFKLFEEAGYFFDFSVDEFGKTAQGAEIESAVIISIFTDRRANPTDEVIGGDYKGWWADTYYQDIIGSRLWTLRRRKATQEVLRLAKEIIIECLQWLVDDGVVDRVEVENEWSRNDPNRMNMAIRIYKPDGTDIEFKYEEKWGVEG
jgi:phage gp46-like protein